jgi:hypothetical protein
VLPNKMLTTSMVTNLGLLESVYRKKKKHKYKSWDGIEKHLQVSTFLINFATINANAARHILYHEDCCLEDF